MEKNLYIDASHPNETRVVLKSNGNIEDYEYESLNNTLVKNNVRILDNCIIGKHGFGFFPIKYQNLRYPHIGIVLIEDNCEIGCGATIDRGSMSKYNNWKKHILRQPNTHCAQC